MPRFILLLLLPVLILQMQCTSERELLSAQTNLIILLTLDTLRNDHLGFNGYVRDITPFLDDLAGKSVVFTRAYSQMPVTAPAHASIFTSLYPLQHGVLSNGFKMDKGVMTITKYLKGQGYTTAAFVSMTPLFASSNLNIDYDVFDEPVKTEKRYDRPAGETLARAREWLKSQEMGEKMFLWIHLFDPHTPLTPPPMIYKEIAQNSQENKAEFLGYLYGTQSLDYDFWNNNDSFSNNGKLLKYINHYDAEIKYMDQEIDKFYKYMEESGRNNNSMWIVTADHGEGLGNHKYLGHGKLLHNDQSHVPLMIHFPSLRDIHGRVNSVVEHVDIFPTIADILDKPISYKKGPIQGKSLLPLMSSSGRRLYSKRYAFIQRRKYIQKPQYDGLPEYMIEYEKGEAYAIVEASYTYIMKTSLADELYRSDDYYHMLNIIDDDELLSQRIKRVVQNLVERMKMLATQPESMDQRSLDQLRNLGYLQ